MLKNNDFPTGDMTLREAYQILIKLKEKKDKKDKRIDR
jgi:hypothetical protein